MDYESFRQQYEQQHPASIPSKPEVFSEYPTWVKVMVGAMFLSAAILSGVHTAPTIRRAIEQYWVSTLAGDIAAAASFIAIELAIFTSAYLRKKNGKLALLVMGAGGIVAVAANIVSVGRALEQTGDTASGIVSIILGLAIPLIALAAGEMFVHITTAGRIENKEAERAYQEALKAFDKQVNTAWAKWQKEATTNVQRVTNERPLDVSNGQGVTPSASILGHTKVPDASKRVQSFFDQYPDALWDENLGVRKIADQLGVGRQTVSNVRQALRDQAKATNGHHVQAEE